jgi:two-component system cell cycle response regulator
MDDPALETLEFTTRADEKPELKGRSFCLIVMAGPDKGATFALKTGTCTLGRSHDCDIVLHGRGISRKHAVLHVKPHGDVIIEDQGSTNGIYLDGERITRCALEAGQTLGLGPEVMVRLELSSRGVQNLLQEMYEGATHDSLTGLYTRRGFEERLEIEFALVTRHKMSSCLAVIDLDRFKAVNDREGHDVGDLVLQALADLLKESARAGDLACRWGGEEFVLYIRQTPLVGAVTMLQRLREQFAEREIELPQGGRVRATFSAGVVDLLPFDDWRTGFRHADEALYQAKRDGRNRVCFYTAPGSE